MGLLDLFLHGFNLDATEMDNGAVTRTISNAHVATVAELREVPGA
jgi:hypothetical protein